MAAAAEAGASGHEVVLLERNRLGGQVKLAGASPTHAEMASTMLANYAQLLSAGRVRVLSLAPWPTRSLWRAMNQIA